MKKSNMNILLLCSYESTYVTQLWENIKKCCPGIRLSLLTKSSAENYYQSRIMLKEGENIYVYQSAAIGSWLDTERIIRKLPEFDIIHSLWMEKPWGWHAGTLKSKAKYWFCSVGGSDLYRDSRKKVCKAYQINILNHSDWFSSENVETKKEFIKIYGKKYEKIPHTINRFGVDIFDAIEERKTGKKEQKRAFDIPKDKVVVCCGYNANPAHQHLKMISSFSRLPQDIIRKLFFVFPMTYSAVECGYIEKVRSAIQEVTNSFIILEDFMSTEEMAEVVQATDVMIHVQTTDQMSSTMLAHMYNGNVVIAGAWLPYHSLKERGVYFIDVNEVDEVGAVLADVAENCEAYKKKCENNEDLVYSMSSWDVCEKEWIAVYEKLLEERIS